MAVDFVKRLKKSKYKIRIDSAIYYACQAVDVGASPTHPAIDTLAQTYNGFTGCVEWLLQTLLLVRRVTTLQVMLRCSWSAIER
jgi:hypothetical protein